MKHYLLEPEVAGGLGDRTAMDASVHPPRVHALHYEISDWLGDDLMESFPCFVVTDRLAESLGESQFGSFELRDVDVSLTPEAEASLRTTDLPRLRWLRVTGQAGEDDLGVTGQAQLVVSERALEALRKFTLDHCEVRPFEVTS
ncbi:MAG: hypothetical protein GEU96_03715 [Propionibacteriales bacterium]|nr:hypothetical protein [Propionibacteriales bacterium]